MSERRQVVVIDLDEPDAVVSIDPSAPGSLIIKKRIECDCGRSGSLRAEVWLGSPR